jgi:hypothetical protein
MYILADISSYPLWWLYFKKKGMEEKKKAILVRIEKIGVLVPY